MSSKVTAALAALALLIAAAPAAAQQPKALKIGAEQDPQTLNPFIDQDEEDFRIWSINWNLLVNFSPKDLSPSPGIAESWDVSDDKKTVTFKLSTAPSGPTAGRSRRPTSSGAWRPSASTGSCSRATSRTSARSTRRTT
jgi:ABC-type oligopeptide transport system substrate-binding subunit